MARHSTVRRLTKLDVTEFQRRKRNGDQSGIIIRHRGNEYAVDGIAHEGSGMLCLFGSNIPGPVVAQSMGNMRFQIVSRHRCYVRKGTFNR